MPSGLAIMKQDNIFKQPLPQVVDFQFNTDVVDVFPDMIRRSVPGYETIISLLGVLGSEYAQKHSTIYDLGCSLGAATLSLQQQIQHTDVGTDIRYLCIDNSPDMVQQCQQNLQQHIPTANTTVKNKDIRMINYQNASVIIINFTLQFLAPKTRQQLLQRIYKGMLPNGCLILSEKLHHTDNAEQQRLTQWHHAFKRANNYSDLEIAQKRAAIENILIPDTFNTHQQRLHACGFEQVQQWFQCFNFSSIIAIKPSLITSSKATKTT